MTTECDVISKVSSSSSVVEIVYVSGALASAAGV
jgi:hypothetical protein